MFGPNICVLKELAVSCKLLSSRGEIIVFIKLSSNLILHLFFKCLCLVSVPHTGVQCRDLKIYISKLTERYNKTEVHTQLFPGTQTLPDLATTRLFIGSTPADTATLHVLKIHSLVYGPAGLQWESLASLCP